MILLTISLCLLLISVIIHLVIKSCFYPTVRFKTKDKTFLITGASSGIGLALACEVIKHGAKRVCIVARNRKQLDEAKTEILSHRIDERQQVFVISCDVTDLEQVKQLVHTLESQGKNKSDDESDSDDGCDEGDKGDDDDKHLLDHVIINQGMAEPGYFLEQDPSCFKRMIDVNYLGGVYLSRLLLPIMMRNKGKNSNRGGSDDDSQHLVFVSSVCGIFPMIGYAGYCPSKYAIRSFAECLRLELDSTNICVQCSVPPDTETPGLARENTTKPPETKILSDVGGLAKPEHIAQSILRGMATGNFLLTEDFLIKALYASVRGLFAQFPLLFVDWLFSCLSFALNPFFRLYMWYVPYKLRAARLERYHQACTAAVTATVTTNAACSVATEPSPKNE